MATIDKLPIEYKLNLEVKESNIEVCTVDYQLVSIVTEDPYEQLYKTFNKNIKRSEWYCYVDSLVFPIKFDKIDTQDSQVQYLMYQRVGSESF